MLQLTVKIESTNVAFDKHTQRQSTLVKATYILLVFSAGVY